MKGASTGILKAVLQPRDLIFESIQDELACGLNWPAPRRVEAQKVISNSIVRRADQSSRKVNSPAVVCASRQRALDYGNNPLQRFEGHHSGRRHKMQIGPGLFDFWRIGNCDLIGDDPDARLQSKIGREPFVYEVGGFICIRQRLLYGCSKPQEQAELLISSSTLCLLAVVINFGHRALVGDRSRDQCKRWRDDGGHHRLPLLQLRYVNRSQEPKPYGENDREHEQGNGQNVIALIGHRRKMPVHAGIVERSAA